MSVCDQMLIIRENQLFAQISDEDYDALNLIHHFKETPRNEFIYFEAHLHQCLYFLKSGFVKIGYYDKDGNEVIKEILGKGDIFGQFTLEENNLEGEFAQAYKSDVSLCMFRTQEFEKLLSRRPDLSLRYTRQVGAKIGRLENRMVNLLQRDVRSRLLYFFHGLTRQYSNAVKGNTFELQHVLTHDDISRLIASSRQTVTTTMNQLQDEGVINFTRKSFIIPDVKKLQNLITVR